MRVDIPYVSSLGPRRLAFDPPGGYEVLTFAPSWPGRAMTERETLDELALPFSPGADTLFIINDLDRPTPTARLLSLLIRRFPDASLGSILVATGAHRITGSVYDVGRALIGGLYSSFAGRFFVHDSLAGPTVLVGDTSRGTRVEINGRVFGFDSVVAIGSVEPHWFAGYTGGRKSLVPGIAAFETIRENHLLALNPGVGPLRVRGNPLAEDLTEAARLVVDELASRGAGGTAVSFVNAVGKEDAVYGLAVGGLDSAEGLWPRVDEIYRKECPPLDVVIAVASAPMDRTLYQAMKSFENLYAALAPGGAYVLVAACPEGIGPPHFAETLLRAGDGAWAAGRPGGEYRLGDHKFRNPLAFVASGGTMAVVSEWLAEEGGPTMGPFSCHGSIDGALSAALDRPASRGGGGRSIGVFVDAVNVVVA